jgi:hypothetical protein
MSLNMLLRRMKVPVTVHGFRATFRMWATEQGVAFEVAEQALAHAAGDQKVVAYQRSNLLELRRPVMESWSRYVTQDQRQRGAVQSGVSMIMRAAIIVAAALSSMTPASAETLTCSDWQGIRTCQDGHGYISRETQWQGFTIGSNSEGARWTTNRWQASTPPR